MLAANETPVLCLKQVLARRFRVEYGKNTRFYHRLLRRRDVLSAFTVTLGVDDRHRVRRQVHVQDHLVATSLCMFTLVDLAVDVRIEPVDTWHVAPVPPLLHAL